MSSQNENCSFRDVDDLMRTVQLVVHIPTFFLGLVLNLLAIRVFHTILRKKLTEYVATSIYMINLAVFDLLLVLSLLFKVILTHVSAPFSSLCTLVECFYFINMYGSVFTICSISLDRYLAIQYPYLVRHCRSPRKIFGICCTIWVLVWAGSIPVYHFSGQEERYECFRNMSNSTWSAQVVLSLEVFGFLLPMSIIGFCSFRSLHILTNYQNTQDSVQNKRASIWTIASSLVIFVASFLPVHVAFFLQFLVRNGFIKECGMKQNISLFLQLSMCLSNINCCLDVFCYYLVIREVRVRTYTMALQSFREHLDLLNIRMAGALERKPSSDKGAPSSESL